MKQYSKTLKEALEILRVGRSFAYPNSGFLE